MHKLRCFLAAVLGICGLSVAVPPLAHAHDYKVGPIKIDRLWTRATPKGSNVAAGYMNITNTGTQPERLVGGTTDAASRLELHSMTLDNGVMKMRSVPAGIAIMPGETVELKPESLHVMLIGLKQPLREGERVRGTLEFEKVGKVEVEFAVMPLGGSAAGASTDMSPSQPHAAH